MGIVTIRRRCGGAMLRVKKSINWILFARKWDDSGIWIDEGTWDD